VAGNRDRQRRIAREKHRIQRELHRARRQQVRKRTTIILTSVMGLALILGLTLAFLTSSGSTKTTASSKATPTSTATPTSSATTAATTVAEPAHHCTYNAVTTNVARKVPLPSATPDYTASYTATIKTNLGDLKLNLLNSKATCTVNSFVHLAEAAFYNQTPCPRLSTSEGLYMLQCGDPTGKGTGGPGYEFASENLTGATYPAGTLAMANTGAPDSNGSQFFLVYQNSTLSPAYTPFGKIVSGLNILQNVGKRGYGPPLNSAGGGAPKESVEIESVTIKKT